jgi:hypothetical protein
MTSASEWRHLNGRASLISGLPCLEVNITQSLVSDQHEFLQQNRIIHAGNHCLLTLPQQWLDQLHGAGDRPLVLA